MQRKCSHYEQPVWALELRFVLISIFMLRSNPISSKFYVRGCSSWASAKPRSRLQEMAGFRSQFSYLFVVFQVNCMFNSEQDWSGEILTRNTIQEIYLYVTCFSWFLASLGNERTGNLPMQGKQIRWLLESMFSISCSLPANGWKRFFSTISAAPQIFCFVDRFQC